MDFYLLVTLVQYLLEREQRISWRFLQEQFQIDNDTLEALRFELIEGKKLARDDNGNALVWIGEKTPASARADRSDVADAASAAVRRSRSIAEQSSTNTRTDSDSRSYSDAERRQLTVMFCDLVGSTSLSTQMDPEELRDLITSFQDRCRTAIQRYDGFIARYMGDGLLVYFGYPQAHEDDAERAVRAGLDVVDGIASLDAAGETPNGAEIAVRVGVATGPVVVGDLIGEGAAEEAAVVGETPNLAARLQGAAEPNQVVIGQATRRLLGDNFVLSEIGSLELKGLAEPQRAWRVVAAKDVESCFEARKSSAGVSLVGRQEELGLLMRAWEASRSGHGQVVLIHGEAGIGKSTLLEALRREAGTEYTWVAMRASPYHSASTLYPVIEHMKRVFGWDREDDSNRRLKKLEQVAENFRSVPPQESVPLFSALVSLQLPQEKYPPLAMSAKQQRDATLDALNEWLTEEAERNGMLIVWEDLHWADATTVEMLTLLIEQVPTVPMLVIGTFRPEFTPPWPNRSHMTPITLNRLERPEVREVVKNLAGGKELPGQVLEHIIGKADGVPLYVEELTKTILESGVVRETKDCFELAGSLSDMRIPETLQDSLMARLDRVPTAREIAQMGAVLGREFAYEMLSSVMALEESQLQDGLSHLVADELLYQRGRLPRSRYIFKHALIQDAAYHSLLKSTRQHYHREVAKLIQERFPESAETQPELVAHHLTEAGDRENAIPYWAAAGERARGKCANHEAILHLMNALALLNQLPDSRERARQELKLQVSLGHATVVAKGHGAAEAEEAYTRARTLCGKLGDVPEIVPTLFGLWRFDVAARSLDETYKVAVQLGRLADEKQEPELTVLADYALGCTATFLGRPLEGRDHLHHGIDHYLPEQRSLDLYRAAQDPGVACRAYSAIAEWLLGFPDQAQDRIREALDLANQLDDPFSRAFTLCFPGSIVAAMSADEDQLQHIVEEGLGLAAENRFSGWMAFGEVTRAWLTFQREKSAPALEQLRNAIQGVPKVGIQLVGPYFKTLEARACDQIFGAKSGLAALNEGERIANERSEHWWDAEIHRLRGELLLSESGANEDDAGTCFTRALEIARKQKAKFLELRAAISLVELGKRKNHADEDYQRLKDCYSWFTEGYDAKNLEKARSILDEFQNSRVGSTD